MTQLDRPRLSDAMVAMLRAVRDHADPTHNLAGRSAHGGATKTQLSLVRRRLIICVTGWKLTDAGREALTNATKRAA